MSLQTQQNSQSNAQPRLQPLATATSLLQKITLVASDMDGTMTQSGRFTSDLFRAFQILRKHNIRIVLITGRSAGWVNGLASLLPIDGAVAENGGIYFPSDTESHGIDLIKLQGTRLQHKDNLRKMFLELQKEFPQISEAPDNAYRVTDWTFSVDGLSETNLKRMKFLCEKAGWDFTYSNVQCHITPIGQDKAKGLARLFSEIPNLKAENHEVLTIGDSPNDESLFDSNIFPCSVGVANIQKYVDRIQHLPKFMTTQTEGHGFLELAEAIAAARL